MSSKFSRDLQKMTIRLLDQLAAVAEMPAVGVRIARKSTSKPIIIFEKADPTFCNNMSISTFLSLNVPMAIANGGTRADLMGTAGRKPAPSIPPWDVEPLELDTLEQTMTAIGLVKSRTTKDHNDS